MRYIVPAAVLIVLLAGGAFAAVETGSVDSYWRGAWWALSLMTTVGFVGAAPASTAGQIVSALLMLCGFGLLAMTTAAVASFFVREDEAPEEARERAFEHDALARLQALADRLDRLEAGLSDRGAREHAPSRG